MHLTKGKKNNLRSSGLSIIVNTQTSQTVNLFVHCQTFRTVVKDILGLFAEYILQTVRE